jgi:hypothetical protein
MRKNYEPTYEGQLEKCQDERVELEHQVVCLENELARYKRMYCREACKHLYSTGAKWRIRPNPMRSDGVFIEEDCEPGQNRTHFAFMHQFAHDDAEEIVFLLNRATDELFKEEGK